MSKALQAVLTLQGTAANFGDELALQVTSDLTVAAPIQGISQQTITTADDQQLIATTGGVKYFYAKNLDTTNFVILQTTASVQYLSRTPTMVVA